MLAIKSLGYKLFRKQSFILHLGHNTHKLFTPIGQASRIVELKGNKAALRMPFWKEYVVQVKANFFSLVMEKGLPLSKSNSFEAEQFVKQKLQHALTYPKQPFASTYNFEKIKKLEECGIKAGLLNKVKKYVENVNIPVTSAHGDLHAGNIVYIGKKLKIIDWSMFHETGTFLTDYIHFYNYKNAQANHESWTKSIIRGGLYLDELAACCTISPGQLKLIYCLWRIMGEVAQLEKVEDQKKRQIKKYNYALTYLTSKL